MKISKILLLLLTFFSISNLRSECVLVPLTLDERVQAASLIIEGAVQSKTPFWNTDHTMIYTRNTILVSKAYKGNTLLSTSSVDIITLGGVIGDKAVKVEPELELSVGDIGIFMLIQKNGEWVSESGPQGFINIDKHTAEASDVFNLYPAYTISAQIVALTKQSVININPSITNVVLNSKRAAVTISSISPKTITAGTTTMLTIKGTNFNSTMDTNSVQFKNGDDGGLSYIKALKRDYVSWSDTMIRVNVRTKAGTGKIRVVVGGNGNAISADTLKITYAHLNVVSGDSIGYETQEIGMNNVNGITWKMNQKFFDSTGARGAFIRSLERWRCGTFINWDTLGKLNHSAIKPDGVNMCAWDTGSNMGNGVLAQCFSYWSGCFTPGLKWFVNELDIRFRIRPTNTTNWNYTTGNASGTQFHFESVATHELGHGHQLGHVINSSVVMHYSIANGQTKPGLTSNDIAGGNYVITKSATSICGKNAHSKLNSNNCAIVTPVSKFGAAKYTICKNETITFRDSSQGNITNWSWNFGTGATPATANTQGPHNVTYSSGGSKTVTLTITTNIGSNINSSKTVTVQTDSKLIPSFTFSAAEKGSVSFNNTSNGATSSKWYFGDGDSSSALNTSHVYTAGGSYNVKLVTTNTCNSDDTISAVKFAYLNFGINKNSACNNEPVVYVDSSDNNVASWSWTFSGGTPASATGKGPHIVRYNTTGNKSASLQTTTSGTGGIQVYTQNNIVNIGTDTFVTANFIFGYYGKNIVGFDNKSTGTNVSYKWYFGDGDSSTSKHPIHTYTNANNKTVRLVVTGNCNVDDTTIQLRDFTGITGNYTNAMFTVSPNPVSNYFKIVTDIQEDIEFSIFDISGKAVMNGTTSAGTMISTSQLDNGIYIVKLKLRGENGHVKLVVQH